jgi:hypothetical protein
MATRSDIRSYARIRADQDSSTFPTDAQYNTLLDFAGRAVWQELVRAGWAVPLTTVDFTATGATSYTPLSAIPVLVHGVYRVEGAQLTELKRLNEGDRAKLTYTGDAEYYTLTIDAAASGLAVSLFPQPTSGTYRVQYGAAFNAFSADGTAWPGPPGSDELVGLRAAAMAMRKEGNDQGAAQLDREYAVTLESVQTMASWLNMRHPTLIRDVGDPLTSARDPFDFDV